MVSARLRSLLPAVLALMLSTGAGVARADSLAVDFDSGPAVGIPVGDQYLASSFVRWLPNDAGFRPERRLDPDQARSGTYVADVGSDVCQGQVAQAIDCEFPSIASTARLARTATTVTLYAGLFTAAPNIGAQLIGYNAAGAVVVTGPVVPLPTNSLGTVKLQKGAASRAVVKLPPHRFTTPVSITSSAGDIAKFTLKAVDATDPNGSAAIGATLGFDDLTLDFPAGSLPDLSLGSPSTAVVLDGLSTDVPISITRLNGSAGPLSMGVSGLPTGVTATVSPNPVPTGIGTATLHITAADDAPRVDDLADVVVTGDPLADANVAVGLRQTHVGLRVASPYDLKLAHPGAVSAASCADTDVPIVVARDGAFANTVTLTVERLPTGVTADILPSPTVDPGGNVYADRTVRFHTAPGAALPATITVRGTSPGAPGRQVVIPLIQAAGSASIHDPVALARTPQHLLPGTTVTVDGNGFCPGTTVAVGNTAAVATPTIAADARSLTFATPRAASTGQITIRPPANQGTPAYLTSNALTVDNFRNTVGFQFRNPSYGTLSYGELTDAFGSEDMWVTVNPCWPLGDCRLNTGIPDPISYIEWGILNIALHESGGHCFGITVAAEKLRRGQVSPTRFGGAAGGNAFSLPAAGGPSGALGDYLDGQHALQGSAEFLHAWINRDKNATGQLATLHSELAANRDPIVTMSHDGGGVFNEGHAVLAYDSEPVAGGTDIYVYDNNRPSTPVGDPQGTDDSVIKVRGNTWSLKMSDGTTWSGGNGDGRLFITPQSTIPANPSLPSLSALYDLPTLIFGAADDSAHATAASPNTSGLPVLDSGAAPDTAGWLVGDTPTTPVSSTITGAKAGTYGAAVTGPGFSGSVSNVTTKPGVVDQTGTGAGGDGLTFTSGADRSLTMNLAAIPAGGAAARLDDATGAAAGPSSAQAATIQTHVDKGGRDAADLSRSGTLSYQHQGDPTTITFTLVESTLSGGTERFQSPAVRIANGDKVTAAPVGKTMDMVALTVRGKNGRTKRTTVKNRAKAPAKLRLTSLRSPDVTGTKAVSVTVAVSKVSPDATGALGVVLRVMRGKRAVATHTAVSRMSGPGITPVTWALPALPKGRYRLVADARLAVGGTAGGNVTAKRSVGLRVR